MSERVLRLLSSSAGEPPADSLALARVARGDVGALGEVYDRHALALLGFASRASGRSDAEDIVQQTFVIVARIAETYDGRAADARSWLYGIAGRLMQERRRSILRFTRAVLNLSNVATRAHHPLDERRGDLERGLLTLSNAKRVVLVLAEVEGYTCEEIAQMLNVPIGTVWTRLHHARNGLRSFFGATP